MLVADDRISAVIDWGCAMYGDFLYDLAWFEFWSPWYPAWRGIDFRREAARHYESIGLAVPRFEQRLTACQIHIGLAAQAYNAFKERWGALEETARRAAPEWLRGRDDVSDVRWPGVGSVVCFDLGSRGRAHGSS